MESRSVNHVIFLLKNICGAFSRLTSLIITMYVPTNRGGGMRLFPGY